MKHEVKDEGRRRIITKMTRQSTSNSGVISEVPWRHDERDVSSSIFYMAVYPLGNAAQHLTFVPFYMVKTDRNDGFHA